MSFRSMPADLLLDGTLGAQYTVDGLLTVGTPGAARAELGVNGAESGLRFYAADGTTELLKLDALTGNATLANVLIKGATFSQGVGLYYGGTPAAGTLALSIAAAAGTDQYGNAYPLGLGIFSGGTLVGQWQPAGITVTTTQPSSGSLAATSAGALHKSPMLVHASGSAIAGTISGGTQADYSSVLAGAETMRLDGPSSPTGTDLHQSKTLVSMTQGLADRGATGELRYFDALSVLVGNVCLSWDRLGAHLVGTATALLPGDNQGTAETWHAVTPAAGWTQGTPRLSVKMLAEKNMIFLSGQLSHPTTAPGNNTAMCSLPLAYAPISTHTVTVIDGAHNNQLFAAQILPSGTINILNAQGNTLAAGCVMDFEDVMIPLDL